MRQLTLFNYTYDHWGWAFFTYYEFASYDEDDKEVCFVDIRLMHKLIPLRQELNKPINVTCAGRTPHHNKIVGGSPNSFHLKGQAVDIHIPNATYRYQLLDLAFKYGFRGIGIYPNFMHLDIRPTARVVWHGN